MLSRYVFLLAAALCLLAASPADALPVFSDAHLTVDAISPNGDLVQDFTQILYTIDVDSADVRILLTNAAGDTVVGSIQFFTRQGRGVRSVAFDGTIGGSPVPDGSYTVQILGVGSAGEGVEQRNLPLLIDRAAPVVTEVTLVSPPGTVVQDGDALLVQACVSGSPDTVFADFSPLDSVYDPGTVGVSVVSPECRRFSYTISPFNTRPDANHLPVTVTARDRAGNVDTGELLLCLSNFPPAKVSSLFPSFPDSVPIFQNGDTFEIEAQFSSPYPLVVGADFSALDSRFSPDSVNVQDLGGQRYRLTYRIKDANARVDATYPLIVFAQDPGCGRVEDDSLQVRLDNAQLFDALIKDVTVTPTAFSPNGDGAQDSVTIGFTVIEDSVLVIITAHIRLTSSPTISQVSIQISMFFPRGRHEVVWPGSSIPSTAPDQGVSIQVRAQVFTPPNGLMRDYFLPLELDKTPPVFRQFRDVSARPLRNGDLVNLSVTYERLKYRVTADFSALDSQFNPATSTVAFADSGNGTYGIFYSLSANNSRPDGSNIEIPVTAIDEAGNRTTTTGFVRVCLSNNPPRHVGTTVVGTKTAFRNGDRVEFLTRWIGAHPGRIGLDRTDVDFRALDTDFDSTEVIVNRRPAAGDTTVFQVIYEITGSNDYDDLDDAPIYVTVRDSAQAGCGSTRAAVLTVDLDTERPLVPTLAASVQVSREPTAILSGSVVDDTDRVLIRRGVDVVDTFLVDRETLTFSGSVSLVPGSNKFTAESLDPAGNMSRPSDEVEILFVQGNVLQAPGPFVPGAEFFVAFVEPMSAVTLHLFNLEGVEITRLEAGAGDLYRIPWDGVDARGGLASTGPYLVIAEGSPAGGGGPQRLRQAFVFSRRGAP